MMLTVISTVLLTACGGDFGQSADDYILENNLETRLLDDGVHIITNEAGNGIKPPNNDSRVFVNYTGMLTDSTVFDSGTNSYFFIRQLIRGWQVGLREMSVGEKATLIIPASAGYGSSGSGTIPGGATLIFELEMIKFDDGTDTTPQEYIDQNSLSNARELDKGVFIITKTPGNGNQPPSVESRVYVNYEGRLTHGLVFDNNDNVNFVLSNLIEGWQIGMLEMSVGESATLIIPSAVGYGSQPNGSIPPNSTLIFDVDLLDFDE